MSEKRIKVDSGAGQLGFIFFLCYIGAAVYFVNRADGVWEVIFALIKAIAWPAYLVYYSLLAFEV